MQDKLDRLLPFTISHLGFRVFCAAFSRWLLRVTDEPEPPWKTNLTGFLSAQPSFFWMNSCVLWRITCVRVRG